LTNLAENANLSAEGTSGVLPGAFGAKIQSQAVFANFQKKLQKQLDKPCKKW